MKNERISEAQDIVAKLNQVRNAVEQHLIDDVSSGIVQGIRTPKLSLMVSNDAGLPSGHHPLSRRLTLMVDTPPTNLLEHQLYYTSLPKVINDSFCQLLQTYAINEYPELKKLASGNIVYEIALALEINPEVAEALLNLFPNDCYQKTATMEEIEKMLRQVLINQTKAHLPF